MGKRGALLIACLAFCLPAQAAAPCRAESGATLTPLIELYTSEGCSSCPPADRWLAGLPPGKAVPLALHVDYWDYIGWRDRFADARFSVRQREAVRRGGGRTVYTPQVLLDGRDFRGWRDDLAFGQALARIAAKPARAKLALSASRKPSGAWLIRLEGQAAPRKGRAAAHLAIYENGLASDTPAPGCNTATSCASGAAPLRPMPTGRWSFPATSRARTSNSTRPASPPSSKTPTRAKSSRR